MNCEGSDVVAESQRSRQAFHIHIVTSNVRQPLNATICIVIRRQPTYGLQSGCAVLIKDFSKFVQVGNLSLTFEKKSITNDNRLTALATFQQHLINK